MDPKLAALIGWTGNGSLHDLERTAVSKLPRSRRLRVARVARALVLRGEDPVVVARRTAHLPGVSWVASGYGFEGMEECISNLVILAKRYLKSGSSFKVVARVEGGASEGDLGLEANSAILKAVAGTRVGERTPKVIFRVVMAGKTGACGVESRRGVGGVPTSRGMEAMCLVSGGYHSSVMAWMAALSGFSIHLVHSRTDDESLRQVARLYSELSRRMDPSSLALTVLGSPPSRPSPPDPPGQEGAAATAMRMGAWLERASTRVLVGVHPACRGKEAAAPFDAYASLVLLPLLLVQEDEIRSLLEEIGLKEKKTDATRTLSALGKGRGEKPHYIAKEFRGREADQNEVLDALLG